MEARECVRPVLTPVWANACVYNLVIVFIVSDTTRTLYHEINGRHALDGPAQCHERAQFFSSLCASLFSSDFVVCSSGQPIRRPLRRRLDRPCHMTTTQSNVFSALSGYHPLVTSVTLAPRHTAIHCAHNLVLAWSIQLPPCRMFLSWVYWLVQAEHKAAIVTSVGIQDHTKFKAEVLGLRRSISSVIKRSTFSSCKS